MAHARSVVWGVALLLVLVGLLFVGCRENESPLLDVHPVTTSLVTGQTAQITVTRHFSAGPFEVVTDRALYLSSNRNVAAVSERGVVTAGGEQGVALIRVTDPSTDATATVTINVAAPAIPAPDAGAGAAASIAALVVSPNPAAVDAGATLQLSAQAILSDGSRKDVTATVAWSSSRTNVATVNAAGLATGVAAGDTTITATELPAADAGAPDGGTLAKGSAALTVP